MNRTIYWSQEQLRSFDLLWFEKDVLGALGGLEVDVAGATTTSVGGCQATQTTVASLSINVAAGRIYQQAQMDPSSFGALPSDTNVIQQAGHAAAQVVTLSTSGIGAGQSRWSLVQAQFSQSDAVRAGDPTGGVLYYYNATIPSSPFQGPGNDGLTNNTVRQGNLVLAVVNGSAAATGSEVPPNPISGWVPLYLIDLAYGQTAITNAEILTAGPSVGTNVPSNYPGAPILAGLLNSHHSGGAGQAPQINLATEVQGFLPWANIPQVPPAIQAQAGNWAGTFGGTVNALTATLTPAPTLAGGLGVRGLVGAAPNTGPATLQLNAGSTLNILKRDGVSALLEGDLHASALVEVEHDGTQWRLNSIAQSDIPINLTAGLTIYVRADGNDLNTGLVNSAGGAFLTLQAAVNKVADAYIASNYPVTIQFGTAGTFANAAIPASLANVTIDGFSGTPSDTIIAAATAVTSCLVISAYSVTLNNIELSFTFSGTAASSFEAGVSVLRGGGVTLNNVVTNLANNRPLFSDVVCFNGGVANIGSLIIKGSSRANILNCNAGIIQSIPGGGTISSNSISVTVTGAFANASNIGLITASTMTFTGTTISGSRYNVINNSVINTGGGGSTFFPGSTSGTNSNGLYV